jgi:hypothetical protein
VDLLIFRSRLADIHAVIQKWRMKITALPALLCALLACATPAIAQTAAQSSPEDRQRFVAIEQKLEHDPLSPTAREDRSWAIQWLTDAPDVSVTVCLDPLGGVSEKTYAHTPDIVVQYMLAMAAFIVENPGKANDMNAQQLAGVEGALTTYRSIRTARPDDKSPELEKLLDTQSRGELPGFVHTAYLQCSAKSH